MEKIISIREWATIKRIAQSVNPMVLKKQAVYKKMKELAGEYQALNAQIAGFEGGVKALCGGLGTEQLIHKETSVIEGKFDKDGKPQKKTVYLPNTCVNYDREKNVYVLTLPEPQETPAPEMPQEEMAASSADLQEKNADQEPVDTSVEMSESTENELFN